jgi:hypothetical protein
MLYKIIPGAKKDHVGRMLAWIKEEEDITNKALLNYKSPQLAHGRNNQKTVLNFQQMRDYLHVFVNIDHDLDGYITIQNFRKAFSSVMNK